MQHRYQVSQINIHNHEKRVFYSHIPQKHIMAYHYKKGYSFLQENNIFTFSNLLVITSSSNFPHVIFRIMSKVFDIFSSIIRLKLRSLSYLKVNFYTNQLENN